MRYIKSLILIVFLTLGLSKTLLANEGSSFEKKLESYKLPSLIEGVDYKVLTTPLSTNKSIEMAIAFYCTHCEDFTIKYHIPQKIKSIIISKNPNIEFNEFHVYFPKLQISKDFAKLRAILKIKNRDDLIPNAFKIAYSYNNTQQILDFLQLHLKISEHDVKNLWKSFSVNLATKNQETLTEKYHIDKTPTIIINGHYEFNLSSLTDTIKAVSSSLNEGLPLTPDEIGSIVVLRLKQMLQTLP